MKDDKKQKFFAELLRSLQLPILQFVATTCLPEAKARLEVNDLIMEEPEDDKAFMAKVSERTCEMRHNAILCGNSVLRSCL